MIPKPAQRFAPLLLAAFLIVAALNFTSRPAYGFFDKSINNPFSLEPLFTQNPKPSKPPKPSPSPKAKVSQKKENKGPSLLSRLFKALSKGISNEVASFFDFFWPFDELRLASRTATAAKVEVPTAQVPQNVLGESMRSQVLGVEEDLLSLSGRVTVLEGALDGGTTVSVTTLDSAGENLLRNSSFEVESDSKPRQWNYQQDSSTSNTNISKEGYRSGATGLKFKGITSGNLGVSQPDVKTIPGRTYTFSTYIKVVDAPSITVKLGFWDEYNNKRGTMKDFTFSGNKDWSRINMTATTSGATTDNKNWFPLIEVHGLTSGSVFLDDAQLEEGSVLTAYNSQTAKGSSGGSLGDGSILGSTGGNLYPAQSGVGSLGLSANKWEDLFLSDDADIADTLTVSGPINANGDVLASDGNLRIEATGYVRIGDSGTPDVADSDDELYVLGDIEADGNLNIAGTLTVTGAQTFTGDQTVTGDLAVNGGDLTTTAATFNLVNAATTVNLGSTAVARTINLGTGTDADTVNIGTGATTANTVNIGTGAVANTIAIGSSSSTTVSINDDNWSVTAAGVASFAGTTVTTFTASGDITWSAATPNIAINNTETMTITDGTNTLFTLADGGTVGNVTVSGTLISSGAFTASSTSTLAGDITFSAATPNIAINNTESLTVTDGTNTLLTVADGGTVGNVTISGTTTSSGAFTASSTSTLAGDVTFSAATPNIAINNTETLTITDGTNTLLSLADGGTVGNLTLNGLASVGLGGTASTTAVCSSLAGATAPTAGTAYELRDCSGAPAADYAERYPVEQGAEFGDVVVLGTKQVTLTNGQVIPQLIKSSSGYQRGLVGVVSDNTGDFTSAGYNVPENENPMSVALVGRVPVKVSGENGAIVAGDYLTTSATAGHAMKTTKAGPVVGMALESFSGGTGTIVAFVKAAWYDPVEEQKRLVLAALGTGSYSSLYGQVLGATTTADGATDSTVATNPLVGPAADGSLGVLAEEVDLLVHGLLTANNLRVTTAAEFGGTLVVKGLATFEGDLVVKGAFSTGSLDLSGALTRTMTAGSDLSAGDPVVVTGANTVARAGGPSANVVGLAATGASAGSSVKVAVAGTVGGYSGLATGARYYVGSGGAVTTAPGGDSAVHIGIAISGSEMIVQIFESAAPPAPPVVDTATVDTGPTVTVSDGLTSGGSSESSSPTTESSPSPTPEPSPEPTVAPEASPAPSPEPSPSPIL